MATQLSSLGRIPVWQALLVGVVGGGLMGAGWYFLYYEEAAAALASAQQENARQKEELTRMEKKLENYEQEMRDLAAAEEEIQQHIQALPSTEATVDHLMKPFQRQARLVGLAIESWAPGGEERYDYYAKTPVEIHAVGTWHQTAEFFRKVSEMSQVVNVEGIRLTHANIQGADKNALRVDFTAASFRFLAEQASSAAQQSRRADPAPGAAPAAPAAPTAPAPAPAGMNDKEG